MNEGCSPVKTHRTARADSFIVALDSLGKLLAGSSQICDTSSNTARRHSIGIQSDTIMNLNVPDLSVINPKSAIIYHSFQSVFLRSYDASYPSFDTVTPPTHLISMRSSITSNGFRAGWILSFLISGRSLLAFANPAYFIMFDISNRSIII